MTYRFLGFDSDVGEHALRLFGQRVEMDDDLATEAVAGGCALLPEADFAACGFTASELAAHQNIGTHAEASQEFRDKKHRALLMLAAKQQAAREKAEEIAKHRNEPPAPKEEE